MPHAKRSKSGTPRASSSSESIRVAAGCVTAMCCAAWRRLRCSAIATSSASCRAFSRERRCQSGGIARFMRIARSDTDKLSHISKTRLDGYCRRAYDSRRRHWLPHRPTSRREHEEEGDARTTQNGSGAAGDGDGGRRGGGRSRLSGAAGQDHGRRECRRRHRHHRADARGEIPGGAEAAVRRREQARRVEHDRGGPHREGAARRLHAARRHQHGPGDRAASHQARLRSAEADCSRWVSSSSCPTCSSSAR